MTTDRLSTSQPAVADLSGYRAVHVALRRGAHALDTAVRQVRPGDRRRIAALTRYWRGYAGEVLAHHTIEDDICFPALVERVPPAADLIVRTDDDHHHLDELMDACTAGFERLAAGDFGGIDVLAGQVRALADHMDDHLGFEDADILPLFERHFTYAEYKELDERAAKHLGISSQAAFTIPFIAASVSPAERDHLLGEAPMPFRVLYRLTRGRHTRLQARAFGPGASGPRAVA